MKAWGDGVEDLAPGDMEALVRQQLHRLYPLNRLGAEALARLLPAMHIERYRSGTVLYRAGARPPDVCYVLQGAVCLYDSSHSLPQLRLTARDGEEAMPLPLATPAEERAVVDEDALILHIERVLLDRAMARDPRNSPVTGVAPAVAAPAVPGAGLPPPLRAHRVLIVEHDVDAARACRRMVRELGLRHDWVCSAEEAVEVLRLEQYGAVLLDTDLPAGDYFDVVKEVRVREREVARPRVIAMTQVTRSGANDIPETGIDELVFGPLALEGLQLALGRAGLPLRVDDQGIF
ncbi:response regulator [Solimonas sp. K1W22B-7]|uniref:response regulator n=1 Tax=Solimonas sp. K1W22B-7 TaxID=2303331 RepID=UPI000E3356AD|nr:response regulator [Solimonas sp. K1W22B-7]AXQ27988.1 response regulator [Solimonas sp. K1W22B-7]